MINNYEKIKEMISFDNPEDFYYIQVYKRRKDNPGMEKDMIVLKDLFVFDREDFEKKMKRIIKLCADENARAYMRLNKRNVKTVAMQSLKLTVDYILCHDYKATINSFTRAAGRYHSEKNKSWVVDLDDIPSTSDKIIEISSFVKSLIEETKREPKITVLPTKNGSHLICQPFNVKKFKDEYPDITVHKDNPTILYCP